MRNRRVIIQDSGSRFFEALKDVFIGAEVEGESGYINLMRIKSKYFDKIFKLLQNEIDEKTKEFPEFKEELFDKLYSFFKRYFSESGSIYFRYTPFSERIYERVYTDNEDVVMFWKTHMLYYVKTDIQPKSMEVVVEDVKFFFDVSKLQHKKANEKKELIYELKEIREDGTIVFYVLYSEKGRKTKEKEILKDLKKKGINLDEEILEKAFRVFEKQNEVDYFINKNARQFLKEQFDLWLYQYVYSDETQFTEKRIKQLKVLKEIAYKIIDFIAQFEDELVKIWQKPKFVLNSNYVITLDRIAEKEGGIKVIEKIIERLLEQKKEFERDLDKWREIKSNNKSYRERFEEAGEIRNQIVEWYLLDLIDEGFDPKMILINGITGKVLNPEYQFLPIDTKYFKDLELEILSLFDNLDEELDGWLIKSENWQALNTILPKFKEKVQTIYIDPPYNTGKDEFIYKDKFQHSSWLTMMENRLKLAREILSNDGIIAVSIDNTSSYFLRMLMDDIFGDDNYIMQVVWHSKYTVSNDVKFISQQHEYLMIYTKDLSKLSPWFLPRTEEMDKRYSNPDNDLRGPWKGTPLHAKSGSPKMYREFRFPNGFVWRCPPGRYPRYSEKKLLQLYYDNRIYFPKDGKEPVVKTFLSEVEAKGRKIGSVWKYGEVGHTHEANEELANVLGKGVFDNPKPTKLIMRSIQLSESGRNDKKGGIILDFFAGSGTTAHAVMKLNKEDGGKRKFILVEMADYFEDVIIPRIKKVAYSFNWKDGEPQDADGIGIFVKYYELEQYEDTLRRVKYADADPFFDLTQDPYNQYIFMKDLKLLEALEIDYKNNKVKVNLEKLYNNVDIAETLSNLLGKWIKRITEDYVEFEDGEKVNIKDLDYKLIKPLIWW